MNIKPARGKYVVKTEKEAGDKKSKGGIILANTRSHSIDLQRGEVLAVGPGVYQNGIEVPPLAEVGQTVLFRSMPNSPGDSQRISQIGDDEHVVLMDESMFMAVEG